MRLYNQTYNYNYKLSLFKLLVMVIVNNTVTTVLARPYTWHHAIISEVHDVGNGKATNVKRSCMRNH